MAQLLRFTLLFLTVTLSSGRAFSQQLILSSKNGVNSWFHLYAGDRLKIEFSGESKKMQTYFHGASSPVTSAEEFMKRIEKVDNVETKEWVVTKEGPHKLMTFKVKGEGDMKVYRYPAPGKENEPTLFTAKYSFVYVPVKTTSPHKHYRKVLNPETKLFWGSSSVPVANNYLPADRPVTKTPAALKATKSVVVYDQPVRIGLAPNADSLLNNQLGFGFQKGDTVTFEITYNASSKLAPNTSYVFVARPDEAPYFKPDLALTNGMPNYLLKELIPTATSRSGTFAVNNDGIFCFYFQEQGTYNVKIVRHVAPNGDPEFKLPIEWIQVYRQDVGYYVEEPLLK